MSGVDARVCRFADPHAGSANLLTLRKTVAGGNGFAARPFTAHYSVDHQPLTEYLSVESGVDGMKLANIAPAIARVLDYPEATASVIARFGRDAKLLTHGARGRHVPEATALDAARLLIAMMVTESPARAPDIMRDFGGLQLLESLSFYGDDRPEDIALMFPAGISFDAAVARVLTSMSDLDSIAWMRRVARQFGHNDDEPTTMFPIDVVIDRSGFEAKLCFFDAQIIFTSGILQQIKTRHDRDESEQERLRREAIFSKYRAMASRYERAIKVTCRVEVDVVAAVASLLSGIRFDEALDSPEVAARTLNEQASRADHAAAVEAG